MIQLSAHTRLRLLGYLALFCATLTSAYGDLASSIAAGRNALKASDLASATINFKAAVDAAPNDPEANLLYGLCRAASVEATPEMQAFLTKLGVGSANRNIFHWKPKFPAKLTTTATSDDAEALLFSKVVPELEAAELNLKAVTNTAFTCTLSAEESHTVGVVIDYGDILFLRSLLKGFVCGAHILDTQESNLPVAEVDKLLLTNGLTVQRMLATKPTLFTAETGAGAAAVKAGAAFADAVDVYVEAITFIRARVENTGRLVALDPSQDLPEQQYRAQLVTVRNSLSGALAFDTRTTVNAGAFVAAPQGIRGLLPTAYLNNGPAPGATIPDPTFGGVLPGMTSERALEWFVKLKHDLDHGFRFRDDPVNPSLVVTSPRGNVPFDPALGDAVIVKGTAKDNEGVARVVVVVNEDASYDAQITPAANGKGVNWEVTVPVEPGPNSVRVTAFDAQPNPSKTVVSSFRLVKTTPFHVTVVGSGSVNRTAGTLVVGSTAQFVAKPAKGFILKQWVVGPGFSSTNPKLRLPVPNAPAIDITAVFEPNPFPSVAGGYNNVIYNSVFDPNVGDFVDVPTGFYSVKLGANGSFSFAGNLLGTPLKAKGTLDSFGFAHLEIARRGRAPIILDLRLDLEFGGLSVDLLDRDTFDFYSAYSDSFSDASAPAKANIVLSADRTSSVSAPDSLLGSGYATLTRDKQGFYRVAGALPDGTKLGLSVYLAVNGDTFFPVFQRFSNGGQIDGSILIDPILGTLEGSLHWVRPATASGNYTDEVDAVMVVRGTSYVPPMTGENLFPFSSDRDGVIEVQSPLLGTTDTEGLLFNSDVVFSAAGVGTIVDQTSAAVTLKFTKSSGLFSGTYKDPDGGAKRKFTGVLVQPGLLDGSPAVGEGFALRFGHSDSIRLEIPF